MQPVFFSKDILGTERSLRISGESLRLTDDTTHDEFSFGCSSVMTSAVEDILPIFGFDVPALMNENLRQSYRSIYGEEVNWHRALGTQRFVRNLKRLYGEVSPALDEIIEHKYLPRLRASREILTRLQPALVDPEKISQSRDQPGHSFLDSFMPVDGNTCAPIRYSHDTTTGRLTVKSGPKILNLSREHRGILQSRFRKGAIGIIDFVSLEPRTALLLTRDEAPLDIYETMRKEIGSQHTRAQLKVATISALYGQRGETAIPQSVISRFFGLPEIHRRHLNGETLCNLYGRPLESRDERLKLPHFVQSTAVDVALTGFTKVHDRFQELVPLFVIHDAIVVDAERDLLQQLSSTGLEVDIDPLGKFYLTVKLIDEDNS